MKITLTSDKANKMIKKLQDDLQAVLSIESEVCVYSIGVNDINPQEAPDYDFIATQDKIAFYRQNIGIIKHALNVFNTTTKLPGFGNMTIDQALVEMAFLNKEKFKLNKMRVQQEKIRSSNDYGKDPVYVVRNYNKDEAEARYEIICSSIERLQESLNVINVTGTFEVDLPD